ncbi:MULTISPECIES: hypothetical protein [unclassified Bacillus (in: firmicutes)]|uniref:hypothetical protein n=1 Tax=unclassified Bacillus (in: firmicutes) TaxID=185979 RepID=UPI0008EA3690|nr:MULTISPECIES: hypothetical protein [unclassified Bacillus (in: firmicutes)]SFI51621.1 hypothetical protein SAMN04488574_103145 [Bacillus sp. 71mf]SFS48405.1 hypothetical protein SAMN04488145_101757 [Bacillus sp. 103mf]
MNILNWFISLFTFGRGTQRVFQLFRNRRNNRNWIWISLLSIGTIFGLAASRNTNMMRPFQRFFRGLQNRTVMPMNLNLTNMEIANEITPNKQKKY